MCGEGWGWWGGADAGGLHANPYNYGAGSCWPPPAVSLQRQSREQVPFAAHLLTAMPACLPPRHARLQRSMIAAGCVTLARRIGGQRTLLDLLPCLQEQVC